MEDKIKLAIMGSNFLNEEFFLKENNLSNIEIVEHIAKIDFLKLINVVTNYTPTAVVIDLTNSEEVYEAEFKNFIKIFPKLSVSIIIDDEKEKKYEKLLKNLLNYINDDIIVFYTKKNGVNNFGDILENINYFNNLFAKETNHTSKKFDIWHFIPYDITSTLTNFAYIIVDYICKKLNYDYKNEFEREIYAAIIGVIMFFIIIFILLYLSHSSIIKY